MTLTWGLIVSAAFGVAALVLACYRLNRDLETIRGSMQKRREQIMEKIEAAMEDLMARSPVSLRHDCISGTDSTAFVIIAEERIRISLTVEYPKDGGLEEIYTSFNQRPRPITELGRVLEEFAKKFGELAATHPNAAP